MTLLDLQRRMLTDVRRPLTSDWGMRVADEDGTPLEEIAKTYIKPNPQLTSFERLEIYNRQYWFRTIAAVSEDFPALNAVLGGKRFDALVLSYLQETPSTSWTLRDLSAKLPDFLSAHPELASKRHSLALDVARLEWAYVEAYDGKRRKPLTAEDLETVEADSILTLQPHLKLLALSYPVDELVLAVHRSSPETDIVSSAASRPKTSKRSQLPPMRQRATWLAVHRFEDTVYYRRIERETYLLLSALNTGASIAEAIAQAFADTQLTGEEQAALLQEAFAHASELGWLCLPEDTSAQDDFNGSNRDTSTAPTQEIQQ